MPELLRVTPFLLVADMDRALRFYVDVLGFEARVRSADYAFVIRDAAALRLIPPGPGVDLSDPARQIHCYIDVRDVDALHAECAPRLAGLPKGRVRPPFDTAYGQREFHVIDEDVTLLSFGQPIG